MNDVDVEKFKLLLMEELVLEYKMSEFEAQHAIAKSTVCRMIKKSPNFILHYSVEDNAKEIYDEYMGIPLEM